MSVGDAVLERHRDAAEGPEVLEERAAGVGAGGSLVLVMTGSAIPEVVES